MVYLALLLLISAAGIFYLKGRGKKRNPVVKTQEGDLLDNAILDELKILSDNYMRLISGFTFSTEALHSEMKEVLNRTQGLSANSEEQAAAVMTISGFIETVDHSVKSFTAHARQMSELSSRTYEIVHAKHHDISQTVDMIESQYRKLQTSVKTIEALETKTKEAENLISSINRLSDQTNLLALNASIEAARAGDAGLGFSVVANEVKKLSDETSKVVKGSTELLKDIICRAHETKENMRDTVTDIHGQSCRLKQAVTDLVSVEQASKTISEANDELAMETTRVADSFSDILTMVQEMNHAVEDVASASVEINQSVEYETQMVDQLYTSLKALSDNNLDFSILMNKEFESKREEVVVVATSPYAPFVTFDNETGEAGGIDIDLIRRVYDGTEYTVKGKQMHIDTLKDLSSKRVAVLHGYAYFDAFDKHAHILKDYNTKEEIMFHKLVRNQADVVIMNEYSGDYYIRTNKLDRLVEKEGYKWGTRRD